MVCVQCVYTTVHCHQSPFTVGRDKKNGVEDAGSSKQGTAIGIVIWYYTTKMSNP